MNFNTDLQNTYYQSNVPIIDKQDAKFEKFKKSDTYKYKKEV